MKKEPSPEGIGRAFADRKGEDMANRSNPKMAKLILHTAVESVVRTVVYGMAIALYYGARVFLGR